MRDGQINQINQSINQSINRSINWSIDQSVGWLIVCEYWTFLDQWNEHISSYCKWSATELVRGRPLPIYTCARDLDSKITRSYQLKVRTGFEPVAYGCQRSSLIRPRPQRILQQLTFPAIFNLTFGKFCQSLLPSVDMTVVWKGIFSGSVQNQL